MNIEPTKDTSLKNWWKKVIPSKQEEIIVAADQVFQAPLEKSLKCARAAIAYADNNTQYVGFIPVIVAKCGSFLKDQGLYTEGIFRVSGNAKRIGELQQIFNTAPDFGKQLDWKGYSVHDAASVLRRFLNNLPEPVIIRSLYDSFINVINTTNLTKEKTISRYQNLIEQLPEYHQYLLFYLLDLLSMFSQNCQITKMDTFNLSVVFTPGILMAYDKTSQKVVQFLIENQHQLKMPRSSFYKKEPENYIPSVLAPFNTKEQKIKRAKTLPARRSRYGPNDPVQVVQSTIVNF